MEFNSIVMACNQWLIPAIILTLTLNMQHLVVHHVKHPD